MLTLTVAISILAGIALGQRFKVFVLGPAMALIIALAIILGTLSTESRTIVATTSVAVLGVQIGYMLGIGLRHLTLLLRASRFRPGSFTGVKPLHVGR
jgi:uncharacterized membrane protein